MKAKLVFSLMVFLYNSILCQESPEPWFIARIFNNSCQTLLIEDCDYRHNQIQSVSCCSSQTNYFRIEDAHLVELKAPTYTYYIGLQADNFGLLQKVSHDKIPVVLSRNYFQVTRNGQVWNFNMQEYEELVLE